jgi:hypothetical protein
LVCVAIAFGLAGGPKSTGGAVYTASGTALTVALGGQALVPIWDDDVCCSIDADGVSCSVVDSSSRCPSGMARMYCKVERHWDRRSEACSGS